MPGTTPTTWLAEFADWLTAKILNNNRTPAFTIDRYGQRLIVWGPEKSETFDLDPPGRRLVFTDLASFVDFCRSHAAAAGNESPAGPSARPWHPCVCIGPKFATFQVDPHRQLVAALTLATHPAFELLETLEKAQTWHNQKAAHDLARLDLARLLPKEAAETLAAVAFRVTSTTSRQVGPMTDRGVREFVQDQPDPTPAGAAKIVGPFEISAPVFNLPTKTSTGPAAFAAPVTLDLSSKLADDGTPLFRLAPIVGQCRLARLTAAGTLAETLEAELAERLPVYLAHAATGAGDE